MGHLLIRSIGHCHVICLSLPLDKFWSTTSPLIGRFSTNGALFDSVAWHIHGTISTTFRSFLWASFGVLAESFLIFYNINMNINKSKTLHIRFTKKITCNTSNHARHHYDTHMHISRVIFRMSWTFLYVSPQKIMKLNTLPIKIIFNHIRNP